MHHVCENPPCINPEHLTIVEAGEHFNGHRDRAWYEKRMAKPEPAYAEEARQLYGTGEYTFVQIGKKLGIAPQTAHRIVRGERWSGERAVQKPKEPPAHWQEVRRLYATGSYSQTALAKMFGISQPGVSKIVRQEPQAN